MIVKNKISRCRPPASSFTREYEVSVKMPYGEKSVSSSSSLDADTDRLHNDLYCIARRSTGRACRHFRRFLLI